MRIRDCALVALAVAAVACGDESGNGSNGAGNGGNGNVDPRVGEILALEGSAVEGETTYLDVCGNDICHGADGVSGPGGNLAAIVPASTDAGIVTVVLDGVGSMPSQSALENQEIADVLAYLRAEFP